LVTIKWLRERGCPWTDYTVAYAASAGYLHVVKWARSQGCPWSEWTCTLAAKEGRLEVLQWMWENGCPWDDLAVGSARNGGHKAAIKWLQKLDLSAPRVIQPPIKNEPWSGKRKSKKTTVPKATRCNGGVVAARINKKLAED